MRNNRQIHCRPGAGAERSRYATPRPSPRKVPTVPKPRPLTREERKIMSGVDSSGGYSQALPFNIYEMLAILEHQSNLLKPKPMEVQVHPSLTPQGNVTWQTQLLGMCCLGLAVSTDPVLNAQCPGSDSSLLEAVAVDISATLHSVGQTVQYAASQVRNNMPSFEVPGAAGQAVPVKPTARRIEIPEGATIADIDRILIQMVPDDKTPKRTTFVMSASATMGEGDFSGLYTIYKRILNLNIASRLGFEFVLHIGAGQDPKQRVKVFFGYASIEERGDARDKETGIARFRIRDMSNPDVDIKVYTLQVPEHANELSDKACQLFVDKHKQVEGEDRIGIAGPWSIDGLENPRLKHGITKKNSIFRLWFTDSFDFKNAFGSLLHFIRDYRFEFLVNGLNGEGQGVNLPFDQALAPISISEMMSRLRHSSPLRYALCLAQSDIEALKTALVFLYGHNWVAKELQILLAARMFKDKQNIIAVANFKDAMAYRLSTCGRQDIEDGKCAQEKVDAVFSQKDFFEKMFYQEFSPHFIPALKRLGITDIVVRSQKGEELYRKHFDDMGPRVGRTLNIISFEKLPVEEFNLLAHASQGFVGLAGEQSAALAQVVPGVMFLDGPVTAPGSLHRNVRTRMAFLREHPEFAKVLEFFELLYKEENMLLHAKNGFSTFDENLYNKKIEDLAALLFDPEFKRQYEQFCREIINHKHFGKVMDEAILRQINEDKLSYILQDPFLSKIRTDSHMLLGEPKYVITEFMRGVLRELHGRGHVEAKTTKDGMGLRIRVSLFFEETFQTLAAALQEKSYLFGANREWSSKATLKEATLYSREVYFEIPIYQFDLVKDKMIHLLLNAKPGSNTTARKMGVIWKAEVAKARRQAKALLESRTASIERCSDAGEIEITYSDIPTRLLPFVIVRLRAEFSVLKAFPELIEIKRPNSGSRTIKLVLAETKATPKLPARFSLFNIPEREIVNSALLKWFMEHFKYIVSQSFQTYVFQDPVLSKVWSDSHLLLDPETAIPEFFDRVLVEVQVGVHVDVKTTKDNGVLRVHVSSSEAALRELVTAFQEKSYLLSAHREWRSNDSLNMGEVCFEIPIYEFEIVKDEMFRLLLNAEPGADITSKMRPIWKAMVEKARRQANSLLRERLASVERRSGEKEIDIVYSDIPTPLLPFVVFRLREAFSVLKDLPDMITVERTNSESRTIRFVLAETGATKKLPGRISLLDIPASEKEAVNFALLKGFLGNFRSTTSQAEKRKKDLFTMLKLLYKYESYFEYREFFLETLEGCFDRLKTFSMGSEEIHQLGTLYQEIFSRSKDIKEFVDNAVGFQAQLIEEIDRCMGRNWQQIQPCFIAFDHLIYLLEAFSGRSDRTRYKPVFKEYIERTQERVNRIMWQLDEQVIDELKEKIHIFICRFALYFEDKDTFLKICFEKLEDLYSGFRENPQDKYLRIFRKVYQIVVSQTDNQDQEEAVIAFIDFYRSTFIEKGPRVSKGSNLYYKIVKFYFGAFEFINYLVKSRIVQANKEKFRLLLKAALKDTSESAYQFINSCTDEPYWSLQHIRHDFREVEVEATTEFRRYF